MALETLAQNLPPSGLRKLRELPRKPRPNQPARKPLRVTPRLRGQANWQGLRRTQNPPSTSESDGNNNNDNINGGHGGRGSGGGGSNNNNDGGNGEGRFLRRMGFVGLLGTSYLASAQRARAEGEKQVEQMFDGLIDKLAPYASTLGISGLVGLVSAMAAKTMLKASAVALGVFGIVVQCLSYKGFLTVHWEEMERQGKAMLDFDKDGKTDSDDMKFLYRKGMGIVATGLPSAAGFYGGFALGLKV